MTKYTIDDFTVRAPSKYKNKKYDVYRDDEYLLSFGNLRYQHYRDLFGHYSYLNHFDEKRRLNYRKRHKNDHIYDPYYAGHWAYHYLW